MAEFHFTETTSATPEEFVAALTDFGPGRGELFGRSEEKYLHVYSKGPTTADVKEGSGGFWERLQYDWTDPRRVTMKTIDSNAWGGHSGHVYAFTPQPDGTTRLDVDVVREGKNLKGKATALMLGAVGRSAMEKPLKNTIKAVEERNNRPHAQQ